jgi:monoamine oxidase
MPAAEVAGQAAEAWSRRRFLKTSMAAGTVLAVGGSVGCPRPAPRTGSVAIIGAGIAGLNAAYTLKREGVSATIFEASDRVGGRIRTATDIMAPGLYTELGGEFIDSIHDDMFALVDEFGLELLDLESASEQALTKDAYYFNNSHYGVEDVIEAFQPLVVHLEADIEAAGDFDYTDANDYAKALDATPLSQYLDNIGASGLIRELLEVAYVTEYGLDADEQSPFNLLYLIGTDTSAGFNVFGESDERYKVRGGNQQIVNKLAESMLQQFKPEHRLARLDHNGREYVMVFERKNGTAVGAVADHVILALPFTLLREVDIRISLPPAKRKAIDELGYGTNAKLCLGFDTRVWREQGYAGYAYTDEPFQLCWDNAQLQEGEKGGLTLYSGGGAGVAMGGGTAASQALLMLPGVNEVFPGALNEFNGAASRFHWPTHSLSKGSYACYMPGQWTSIGGVEGEPVDELYFAGEHCSIDFQGYMNGGAETGRLAAEMLLAKARGKAVTPRPRRFRSRRLRVGHA